MKLAALALIAGACTDALPPETEPVTSFVTRGEYRMQYGAQVDLLFVVENTPATTAVQPQLRDVERRILERLGTFDYGKLPDVHLGVATADLADQGRLRRGRYLSDSLQFDEQRHRNYAGGFEDAALDLLDVGTNGGTPAPIEAAARALSEITNPGFSREYRNHVVVFVTAGDDRGTAPIDDLIATLRAQRVTGIGALIGSCDAPTPRLDALFDAFGGERVTLCEQNPERAVDRAGYFLQTLEGRCLAEPALDLDAATPGVQHDCSAWLVDPLTGDERRFHECSAEHPTDCWAIADSYKNGCDPGRALVFQPSRTQYPATAVIECVAERR